MNEIDQLEQWRLAAQKTKGPSAPSSASTQPVDELEQWRLQAQQKKQATTPATTPQTKPVEASKPVAEPSMWQRLVGTPEQQDAKRQATKFAGRGSSMTGKEVRAATEQRKAQYEADVASGAVVPFEQLAKDDSKFKIVTDFMETVGEKYDPKMSREAFVKEYMSKMRFMENNDVGTVKLLSKLNNSDKVAAGKLANAYVLFSQVPNAGVRGGQGGIMPALETLGYNILSPSTLASFGVGAAAKQVAKQAGKDVLKQKLISAGAAGALDLATSVGTDALLQKAEQDAQRKRTDIVGETPEEKKAREEKPFELDMFRTSVNALTSAVITTAAVKSVGGVTDKLPSKSLKQRIDEAEGFMGPPLPPAARKAKKEVIDATNAKIDEEVKRYVQEHGESILKEMGPAGPLADAKVRTKISENAVNVAMNVIRENPDFALKENERISDAINRVLSQMDEVDDLTLESAMRQQNVSLDEMAAALRVTQSEAGRTLQQLSVVSKMINRLRNIDPAFDTQIKKLYQDTEMDHGIGTSVADVIRRAERESKAFVVSRPSTTIRNMLGSTAGLTIKSATRLFEGFVYSSAQAIESMVTGKPARYSFGQNMEQALEDSIRPWKYLADQGLSKELTDMLLNNNPSLQARLLGLGEDDKGISAPAKLFNSFNQWQDGMFRRSAFVESIDRQLNDVGVDLMDLLKEGKMVPKDVIARASDDAMKATMSYMPKVSAKGGAPIDAAAEHWAAKGVQFFEKLPGGSLLVTFPRFMANAMAFQYRHSPLGFASTLGDRAAVKAAYKTGDAATIALAERQARDHVAQASMGTIALMAAIQYRRENQETPWGEMDNGDGTTTDIRAIWPLGPYFAAADVYVKMSRGVAFDAKGAMEAIVGMKMPAGSQNTILERLADVMSSEDKMEQLGVTIGKVVGDFAGRFTEPFVSEQVYDMIDALSGNTTVRDPNILDEKVGSVEMPKWLEAGIQRVQNKLPIAKNELEPAAPRFSENKTMTREGELISNIIGARSVAAGNDVVKEATRLGLEPFKLFGRPTGEKDVDAELVRAINDEVLPRMRAYINSPDYINLKSDRERALKFRSVANETAAEVRPTVIAKQDVLKQAKIAYKMISAEERKLINDEYARMHNGVTLEEADDYLAAEGIRDSIRARLGMNKGGFVQRRH